MAIKRCKTCNRGIYYRTTGRARDLIDEIAEAAERALVRGKAASRCEEMLVEYEVALQALARRMARLAAQLDGYCDDPCRQGGPRAPLQV